MIFCGPETSFHCSLSHFSELPDSVRVFAPQGEDMSEEGDSEQICLVQQSLRTCDKGFHRQQTNECMAGAMWLKTEREARK